MPKLTKIVALLLIPVFVGSIYVFDFSAPNELFDSITNMALYELSSEGENGEQEEESNEKPNEFDIVILNTQNYKNKKAGWSNYRSDIYLFNFIKYFWPPPELL